MPKPKTPERTPEEIAADMDADRLAEACKIAERVCHAWPRWYDHPERRKLLDALDAHDARKEARRVAAILEKSEWRTCSLCGFDTTHASGKHPRCMEKSDG